MFTAAIFDMDGTLIDSERVIMNAWLTAAREAGAWLGEEHYLPIIGLRDGQWEPILAAHLGSQAVFDTLKARVAGILGVAAEGGVFPLKAGARELLTALREVGVPCAVASSSHVCEIKHRLGRLGILEFFRTVAGGDEVAHGKPHPAIYHLAAMRLGIPSEECLAFEDSEHGISSALAAGMKVAVIPDLKPPSQHSRGAAFQVLETLGDVVAHIPAWFPR